MPRKLNSHFFMTLEVAPGTWHPVQMTIDNGTPPWVVFHMKGRRKRFAMPLIELMHIGFRKAQVRFVEKKLGTEPAAPLTFDAFIKKAAEDCVNAE